MNIQTPECIGNTIARLYVMGGTKLVQESAGSCPGWRWNLKKFFLDKLFDLIPCSSYIITTEGLFSENTYNPVKILDKVSLIETKANFNFFDQETSLSIKKGEPYLGIHINGETSQDGFKAVKNGMTRVACYLAEFGDRLPSDLIIGLTYPALANASRRYGFTVVNKPVPSTVRDDFLRYSRKYNSKIPADVSEVKLCFQKTWEFRAIWGSSYKFPILH